MQNQCKFHKYPQVFHSIFLSVIYFFNFNYCDSCQTTAVIKTLTFNHQYSWVRRSVPNDFTNLLRLNHAQIQGCMFFRKCYYFCFRFAGFGNETWEGTSHQRFSSCKVSSSKSDFSFSFKHFLKSDVFRYNLSVRIKPLYNHLQNQLRWLNNFFHHPPGVVHPATATAHIPYSGTTFVLYKIMYFAFSR